MFVNAFNQSTFFQQNSKLNIWTHINTMKRKIAQQYVSISTLVEGNEGGCLEAFYPKAEKPMQQSRHSESQGSQDSTL